ncbi:MAG: hypothetical protein SGCHY_001903 [Lobulomycetales sp.]
MSCPVEHESKSSGCPVDHGDKSGPRSERINPLNQMPMDLDSGGQESQLSTTKTDSTIPQSNGKGVWEFYNALVRKGWEKSETKDVETMVHIHNFLNEECWKQLLSWEQEYHGCDCPQDRSLLKFKGRPNEPSPKARLLTTFFGVEKPFDRHDWTIDRCGTPVRYVIDYYGGEPDKPDGDPVFYCDVRPALDSPSAFKDRLRRSLSEFSTWLGF